jgi:hypothetical protein
MESGSPRACAQGCSEGRADGVGQGVAREGVHVDWHKLLAPLRAFECCLVDG